MMSTPVPAGARRLAPRDPETFFKAQARNRRATWRMSALCYFAAFLMGIPLTLVLTPFLYAVAMAAADVVNHFSPLPPEFWQDANGLAKFAFHVADAVINQRGAVNPQDIAFGAALVLLPGIALSLVLWAGIRLLFQHGGVGGTIASLNAREPNRRDLQELQLADTVEEMAIAAGLPAPKMMLIDSPGANAALIGTSAADAHIVLSRRLLDELDRDQLQAIVGHLVASLGNGDLHIAFTVTSVFETCGLIVTLINAPFGKESRSTLWRILRYALRRQPPEAKSAEADEVAELLADTLDVNSTDIDRFFSSRNPGLIRKILRFAFFPWLFTNLAVEMTLWFFLNVLLGPSMALLWRTRRYLADAGAVELTRNPDALAGALLRLSKDSTTWAGASWATHLFMLNPGGDRSLRGGGPSSEQQRKAWQATAGTAPAASDPIPIVGAEAQDYARLRKEITANVMAAMRGNPEALARMQAFARAMGEDPTLGLHGVPNPHDILLAQRGDRAALVRLRMVGQSSQREGPAKPGRSGLQTYSMLSFHPPLNKRAKRLQRMGARITASSRTGSSLALKVVLAIGYAIVVPLLAVAGALMLVVIAMMIGLNLLFLGLWLTTIHWVLAQDWNSNIQGFIAFANQVIAALSKASR